MLIRNCLPVLLTLLIIADDDGSEKKKKKKKKKLRKHRVAPNPDEEETGEAKEAESAGVLSNRNVMEGWNTPPGGRSLYTKPASRSPKLEPLEEPTNESCEFTTT